MNKKRENLISIFSSIDDPRIDNHNKRHKLVDILVITLCAVICGFEGWEEIEDFGEAKKDWFKTFLELPHGIPSHDTFRRVFMLINPLQFQKSFAAWTNYLVDVINEVIAIDGKCSRGSSDLDNNKKAIQTVSAWANNKGLVLGQVQVDQKSNEITAIPELLDMIDIKGATITIDAIGNQKNITEKIIDKNGDYVIALKKNQPTLYNEVKSFFEGAAENNFQDVEHTFYESIDEGHGRYEIRNYYQVNDIGFLNNKDEWKNLSSIIMVDTAVTHADKITNEKRYYISSLSGTAENSSNKIRAHWGIENKLHWSLDVVFNEDNITKRARNSAANMAIIRHMAVNLLRKETSLKRGVKRKKMFACIDHEYLLKVIKG
ncbi:MAG: ISAs1 family transposase [Oligoflexia bacterium]|nr:ISAs1 family transposase [Oligoflexia bacterium]